MRINELLIISNYLFDFVYFNFNFVKIIIHISMDTSKKLPLNCPACSHVLTVGELCCEECGTRVCGAFELPPLARLNENEQTFALAFIKSSGSLKEMARLMGLSYPTVRNRLDDLIQKLDMLTR